MTDEMLSRIVGQEVEKAFQDNSAVFVKQLSNCVDPSSHVSPESIKLLITGMRISTQISVQLVIKTLEEAKIIQLPPDGAPFIWTER